MLGIEKKGLNLLLHYRICNIYVRTHASTSLISEMTDMPLSSVKRSIKILDEEFDKCVELLPDAQRNALNMGLITQMDIINEDNLQELRKDVLLARLDKSKISSWQDVSLISDEELDKYIDDTRRLQEYNSERLIAPSKNALDFANLLRDGYSLREVSTIYHGINPSVISFHARKIGSAKR